MKSRTHFCRLALAVSFSLTLSRPALAADDAPVKADPRYRFRTDFANPNLPWYQPKAGEFPPHHSDRPISGELVSADFIHRTGQFRTPKTGDLVEFTLPPYGSVTYLNADADLRDVPLGTFFLFFLNQDSHGNFTSLATMQDQFTMDAGHGFNYRLDELKSADGKLLVTKQSFSKNQFDLGKKELLVNETTRVWKGDAQIKLGDLAVGDELLFNSTGKNADNPGRCTDLWVGADTHKQATQQQRTRFSKFLKARGLPGWVDQVVDNKLTVTLFTGEPNTFKQTWLGDFEVGKEIKVVVANDELRTWNPGVDNEKSTLLEVQKGPVDAYGTSGVTLTFTVAHMLEGFRKGRVVRVFGTGWVLKDQLYGESLMGYGYAGLRDSELLENVAKEYPAQFPFRTDYGNERLSWYQLQAGVTPPRFSEHLVVGELMKVDPAQHCGQFRADHSGETVNFSLVSERLIAKTNTNAPAGSGPSRSQAVPSNVRYLNADADLSDLPVGVRYRFSMYQDEQGAFTRAALIVDEFTHLATNFVTYRIDDVKLRENRLFVAAQIPKVKNYNGDIEQPADLGGLELRVTPETRVWKGSAQEKLEDLTIGDSILINVTGEAPRCPSRCVDIWVDAETQTMATAAQHKKHPMIKPAK